MTDRRGFGLYVHWPFCQAKCPYCDFNSHVVSGVDQSLWIDAFQRELERLGSVFPGRILNTVYFGGGTPSLMHPSTVDAILRSIRTTWQVANDFEVTLEANPTSVDIAHFESYATSGVNRVSVGVQALNDSDLRALGRLHSANEAREAVVLAQSVFPRVSFDLIYARQNQSVDAWREELGEALEMAAGHLSLYQLTIEDGTAFGQRFAQGGLKGLPDEDLSADMFELTQSMTEMAGLPAYEISNHATPGAESAHNLIYWRSHDWLGVGPGAHGRYCINGERIATEAYSQPSAWLHGVEAGSGDCLTSALTKSDVYEEYVMFGLRTREGILFREDDLSNNINMLIEDGFLDYDEDMLKLTHRGRPVLNAILRQILT